MQTKKCKRARILALLRQIELDIAEGETIPQACRGAQITLRTFYKWRKEFGGAKLGQAKRLKRLERENAELKQLVAKLLSRDRF